MAALGNHLKALRTEAGLTQAQLAEKIGVSRKTINTIENRVFVPSTLLALQISRVLGHPVETVFFLEDET